MLSPATKPPSGLAAPRSLCRPGQRGRRPRARIEYQLSSNCGTDYGTSGGTNCRTTPTAYRPRVSLVAVRDLASRRFSTSLPQPFRRPSGVRPEFALWFALRFVLWFALRYALCFAVPAFGVSCFADGGAGFRRSRGFDISTPSNCDRSIVLLAARTDRVVVARRRLFRFARRVVPALDSPARPTDEAS
jgi:hypothetical protein